MKPINIILEDCCGLLLDPLTKPEEVRAILNLVDLWRRGFRNLHEAAARDVERVRALHKTNWPEEDV